MLSNILTFFQIPGHRHRLHGPHPRPPRHHPRRPLLPTTHQAPRDRPQEPLGQVHRELLRRRGALRHQRLHRLRANGNGDSRREQPFAAADRGHGPRPLRGDRRERVPPGRGGQPGPERGRQHLPDQQRVHP